MTRIRSIEVWTRVMPMARTLVIMNRPIAARMYVFVRVRTDDGLEGVAAGLCRGHPTGAEIEALAPSLVGARVDTVRLEGSPRAVSLLDIALWDIRAKAAGAPLHRALGGKPSPLPLVVYGGFDDDLEAELAVYVREARGVKLVRFAGTPEEEGARLARARAAVGPDFGLVYDAGYSFETPEAAEPWMREYARHGLLWFEDPFPHHTGVLLARLRAIVAGAVPLGAGDEWTEEQGYREAIPALDVVRIDAHTAGGVSGFVRIAGLARAAGRTVSAHMHDYVHVHLPTDWVERALDTATIDPLGQVLRTKAVQANGALAPPEEPGLGIEVDWDAIERLPGP